jgi:hypothetical protein
MDPVEYQRKQEQRLYEQTKGKAGEIAQPWLRGEAAEPVLTETLYAELRSILNEAFKFAAVGKGHQRHGKGGLAWTQQRHATIAKELGTGFAVGQAVKKSLESEGLDTDAARRELLGAITYLASAIHAIDKGWR